MSCGHEIEQKVTSYAESTNNKFLIVFIGARTPEFRKGRRCWHLRCQNYVCVCVCARAPRNCSDSQNGCIEEKNVALVQDNMCVICLECVVNFLSVHRTAVRQPYTFSKDSISLTSWAHYIPQKNCWNIFHHQLCACRTIWKGLKNVMRR